MFQDLYRFLRTGGLKVYSLGQQDKICTEPYVLIYEAGTEDTSSSKNLKKESIELWVFYPFNEYSKVETYIKQVEKHRIYLFFVL